MCKALLPSFIIALVCVIYCGSTDAADSEHGGKSNSMKRPQQTNLLYIMFDDLRTELGIYGKTGIIAPNFDRLAARSVVFDNAYCQIAVCNPSRDSLLTGLRPDTVGTYAFQSTYNTYANHMMMPTRVKRSGYTTASFGKIRHWEGGDSSLWDENFEGNWYDYQAKEWHFMNSSVMPDKVRAEETFPDYIFASKAIEAMTRMSKLPKFFMVAIGFKMPHLAMHVPYKYYDMYRDKVHQWQASPDELRYPASSPPVSYRCCADDFRYMRNEGALYHNRTYDLRYINNTIPLTVHQEMMWGYAALITFVDKQLGRVLDAIDQLELWGNLTVVLTADHGMHNGEKGIWEKWTLFDESTHIPLIIAHPQSPYKGQHYKHPVELIDVFPTINDLIAAPYSRDHIYDLHPDGTPGPNGRAYIPLQGKSLAPVVLGKDFRFRGGRSNHKIHYEGTAMPVLGHAFALSQAWRCANRDQAFIDSRKDPNVGQREIRWDSCNLENDNVHQVSVMGYSMRSLDFRYTMYIPFKLPERVPMWNETLWSEELYDHRKGYLGDLGHFETVNVAQDEKYKEVLLLLRAELRNFLFDEVVYLTLKMTQSEVDNPELRQRRHRKPGTKAMGRI